MEMFSKIVLLVFAFYWCMFGSETDEAECIDRWPFCYIYNPPCINNTDHLCPKQCGLCTSSENDTHSANMTCEDKVDDCSSFNLSEGCQSNNTWYREHCRNSCNMCLSDNVTREDGSKIRDQDSSPHTRNNVYHTSVKDALEAECIDRWPYCYVFNPPCLNHTDNELEVRVWCPKHCGLCSHQETDMQSADPTCRDKLDCSPFNLSEGCQSNNTWYRQYCRLSCNVCLSDNGTTERRETDDEDSTPHIGSNISHTSTNDALECQSGFYGSLCTMPCGEGCTNGTCDRHTGICTCKEEWRSSLCNEENIALKGNCTTSTKAKASPNCNSTIIPNNTSMTTQEFRNCFTTADCDYTPFFKLMWNENYSIVEVILYGQKKRMENVTVSVNEDVVYNFGINASKLNATTSILFPTPLSGDRINISKNAINVDDATGKHYKITICEVQVWARVCRSGWYGERCEKKCADGCADNCNVITGECLCRHGWKFPFCQVCNENTYGENCSESCGHCSNETSCNKTDGTCSSCDPGWVPPKCQEECNKTNYGQDCNSACGHCSGQAACDKSDGTCSSCEPGWVPPMCQDACNSTSYGQNCESICGHCEKQAGCNKISGTCTACEPGWIPPLCQDECNSTAYGQDCQQRCGHCSNGNACNKTSGECVSCDPGWIPPLCVKECSKANYGQDCNNTCGHCSGLVACNKSDGTCPSCEPGWTPPLCQEECTNSSYGKDCQHKCGHCSEGAACNTFSGECQSCTPGWYPPLCQNGCRNRTYGQDCGRKCGHCSDRAACNKTSGECLSCEPGWYPPFCQNVCNDTSYGQDCLQTCGHCFDGKHCDKVNGQCLNCELGWISPMCKKECNDTSYGQDCAFPCGHCLDQVACNKTDGRCMTCEPGWVPPLCQDECNDTTYGQNCLNNCGRCDEGEACNKTDGRCLQCALGWSLPLCQECNDTRYGQDCQQNCGHCKNGRICNKTNGHCLECAPGWIHPLCNDECNDTSYGQDCAVLCGHCLDQVACNKTDGRCVTCEPGWVPPLCQDECNDTTYGQNCLNNCGRCAEGEACNKTDGRCLQCALGWSLPLCLVQEDVKRTYVPWIVGGIVIVLLLSAIIIVVVRGRLFSKSKISHDRAENNSTDSFNLSCHPHRGWNPLHSIKTRRAAPDFQNAKTLEISAPTYRIPSESDKPESDTCNSGLYANTMELNAANIRNAKRSQPTSRPPRPRLAPFDFARTVISNSANENDSATYMTDQIYVNAGSSAPALPTKSDNDNCETLAGTTNSSINTNAYPSRTQFDDLHSSILSSLASDQLANQFQALPKGMQYPHDEGLKPENVKKNRFKALCSYDHSRVKLSRAENDSDNDYINASYIKGCNQERAYIAAQGPRTNTIADMWQMIWQEGVIQIVMLTNLIEGGKEKCIQYWPDSGITQTYGRVSVKSLGEEKRADFCIRSFSLTDREATHSRQVYQYHFLAWPDHGIPQAASLVNFWRYIKTRACSFAPLLVHCSAGVGRTGTYIALDIAMDTASSEGDVNVQQIVTRLREDRSIMVQTEVQYTFLHEVILEACTSHATRRTFRQFDELFPGKINVSESNPTIDNEFNTLSQMTKFLPKSQHCISTKADNILKIRDTDIIPDDSHLVHLRPDTNGRNTYINAVFLPSFKQQKRNILTQLPLPDTLLDIWRLVHDMGINTIVSLESSKEEKTVKNYCHYWPNVVGDVLTTGQYAILLNSRNVIGNKLTSYRLTLKEGKEMKYIRLLHYTDWGDDVPEETEDMVLLLETLSNVASEADCDPLLVQCLDGSSKSGLFCVLLDVISRVAIDREIDVYLPSRQVQIVRPKAIANEKQYRYFFKVAQDYKNQFKMYENT